jgi:hypothetical protein
VKKYGKRLTVYGVIIVALLISFRPSITVASHDTPATQERLHKREKVASLQAILASIDRINEEIRSKQDALKQSVSEGERSDIRTGIDRLRSRIKTLEENFAEIASGIDMKRVVSPPSREFDWPKELKEILAPVIDELSRLTRRPREIDRLRREIRAMTDRLAAIKNAKGHVASLAETVADQGIQDALNHLKQKWAIQQQRIETDIAVANEQLKQKLTGRRTFAETLQDLFRIFFKSRGRNLLFSLAAFFGVWFMLGKLHGTVKRISPLHRRERTFSARAFDLAYQIITFLIAVSALLVVLYMAGDWVLLTVAAIILFGMVWASKAALPRFWEQAKLLLNLGTVREGERLVYNGLPWKVKSMGFYTRLVNEDLLGGDIRLPLRELLKFHSRPWKDQEPWFPTKQGDWVLLSDRTHGKVVVQTPEMVELVLLGGSRKVYRAIDFLGQNPMNLSANFRLRVTFSIDYQHQSIVTEEIPAQLERILTAKFSELGYEEYIIKIRVEFQQAGPSSLNVEVLADFTGEAGDKYYVLHRAIQKICVDACTQYGWVIPFTQLTLHMAGTTAKEKTPM